MWHGCAARLLALGDRGFALLRLLSGAKRDRHNATSASAFSITHAVGAVAVVLSPSRVYARRTGRLASAALRECCLTRVPSQDQRRGSHIAMTFAMLSPSQWKDSAPRACGKSRCDSARLGEGQKGGEELEGQWHLKGLRHVHHSERVRARLGRG